MTTYDANGWIVEDNFYIEHNKMQDDSDCFTIFINCPKKQNSITVQENWTGVLRFYLLKNEENFIKFIDTIREISVQDCQECE